MNGKFLVLALAAAFIALPASAGAAAGQEAGASAHAPAQAATAKGVGIVRKVDATRGTVTLQHEAIESLGWPAMVMAFRVRDPAMLQGLEPGKKVHFAFVQERGGYVITAIE